MKAVRIISGELQEERRSAVGNTRLLIGIETLPAASATSNYSEQQNDK